MVWVVVMLLTPPESAEVLEGFVQRVQPPGPGWSRWRRRCEVEASESLRDLLTRFVLSSCVLFGALLGSGAFLLHQQVAGWSGLILTVVSLSLLLRGRQSRLAVE